MKTAKSPQQFIYVAYEEDNHLSVGIRSKQPFPDSIQDDKDEDHYLYINYKAGCAKDEMPELHLSVEYNDGKWTVIGQDFQRIVIDTIGARVEKIKKEIADEVIAGRIPHTVESFSQLHDFVDANEFGGFCEEGYIASEDLSFENAVQNRVDEWIKAGGIMEEVDLFEHYELLPMEVQKIIEKEVESYKDCEKMLKKLKAHGSIFEYGLDASPYNLRKITK